MIQFFKKCMLALAGAAIVLTIPLSALAQPAAIPVSLPSFSITVNGIPIDNSLRKYPFLVYKDVTYAPMTYSDSRFLGLETKWDKQSGLDIKRSPGTSGTYKPDQLSAPAAELNTASIPTFPIHVNGHPINNSNEEYPVLVFRDMAYFPLTWKYMVNEFNWSVTFDNTSGLSIQAQENPEIITPKPKHSKIYSEIFGNVRVIFDRLYTRQYGNLYVEENGAIRKIGNPDYIYGVTCQQLGNSLVYTPVNKVDCQDRWIYTLAINPELNPPEFKNVRVNMDTNEVQEVQTPTVLSPKEETLLKLNLQNALIRQMGQVTVVIDRSSLTAPGNLYVREDGKIRQIGDPHLVYGVYYVKSASVDRGVPQNELSVQGRWIYTLALNPGKDTVSRKVRVNMDTNEVQILTDAPTDTPANPAANTGKTDQTS